MPSFVPDGIMTALVTPFHDDGSLNPSVIGDLIDFQVRAGVSGIVVTAGSGEYVTLSPEERVAVIKAASTALHGRLPLVAGILAADTGSAVSAAVAAGNVGVDALLVLTPYYLAPSADGLVDHFRAVAERARLPIILYNNPARTGINLEIPILERLVEIPEVVAIKECDRDLGRVARKIERLGGRLSFLNGDDDLCLPFFAVEPRGAIMSGTNLTAPWAVAVLDHVRRGRWDDARRIFRSQLLAFIDLYRGADHPGPLKQAMGVAGFRVGTGRPPLRPISEERLKTIAQRLETLGLVNPRDTARAPR